MLLEVRAHASRRASCLPSPPPLRLPLLCRSQESESVATLRGGAATASVVSSAPPSEEMSIDTATLRSVGACVAALGSSR